MLFMPIMANNKNYVGVAIAIHRWKWSSRFRLSENSLSNLMEITTQSSQTLADIKFRYTKARRIVL